MSFLNFMRGDKKSYIKSPIAGKVLVIKCDSMIIENKNIKITRPLVELGAVVEKGQIIGF